MFFIILILLSTHLDVCQKKKVYHYERNIEIIEHADIQSLFQLIDEINEHTSSLAQQNKHAHLNAQTDTERLHHNEPNNVELTASLSSAATNDKNKKNHHGHRKTYKKLPNLLLRNLYCNKLIDLHIKQTKIDRPRF